MKVDAYYVPCSYLLVLIKRVYESVCGVMCALVGVTGSGECVKLTTEILRSTWVFTLLCYLTRDKQKYHATGDVGVTIVTTLWLDLACYSYFHFMS